ncbi:MAG: leucine-rich repeat protein [Bacteroidales bacterium]|nr:leucine-rich repeat protein [Bacteroidales bacterium]
MKQQRFQEILSELRKNDFGEILDLAQKCFHHEHAEEMSFAKYYVKLYYNWNVRGDEYRLEAEEVIPTIENLDEGKIFCLDSISIIPVVVYSDPSGREEEFTPEASSIITGCKRQQIGVFYSGDIQPHWKELRFRIKDGEEQRVKRQELHGGEILAKTKAGTLKVVAISNSSIIIRIGIKIASLQENREFMQGCLPGVEAAVFYDHEEYPALWSWVHIDRETDGESPKWYDKFHNSKDELYEGYQYGIDFPVVKIEKICDRKVILSVEGRKEKREIVLDKPNHTREIWRSGKQSLNAKIYVTEPKKEKSNYYNYSEALPTGCVVKIAITKNGEETPCFSDVIDIRSLPCKLRTDEYKGDVIWNWPYVWGFQGGKMVIGVESPSYNSNSATYKGMVSQGEELRIPIDDEDQYSERTTQYGEMAISWGVKEATLEIRDGELMSIPDVEEFVIPSEAKKTHYQSLLSTTRLRRITIPSGMESFANALDEYHEERGIKLDVVFEGTIQEWFDKARGLSNHIGHLEIDGKEYDFYDAEEVVIPEGVRRIGDNFFSDSKKIRNVVLPPWVEEVGDHAFAYCERLETVKVLGAATIGISAFVSCKELRDIYLADGVKALGAGCFDFLTKVRSIYIPKSVKRASCLSRQNDGSYISPVFLCEAKTKPKGWVENWNLTYYDPRFGLGHGYDYYHPVEWGVSRREE